MLAVSVPAVAAQGGAPKNQKQQQPKQQKQQQKQFKAIPAAPLPAPALERFLLMSPDQQQRALQQLPPDRQRQFQTRLKWFQQLPADSQNELRTRYEAFLALPQPRRQALRQELQRLRDLSPAARTAAIDGGEERQNFSPEELEILRSVAGTP